MNTKRNNKYLCLIILLFISNILSAQTNSIIYDTLSYVAENGLKDIKIKYHANSYFVLNQITKETLVLQNKKNSNIIISEGSGENELKLKHANIFYENRIIFYDQMNSKILTIDNTLSLKPDITEHIITEIYDIIIPKRYDPKSKIVDFVLFSMTASKISKYNLNFKDNYLTKINTINHSENYFKLRKENVLFTINDVHVYNDSTFILINHLYPIYMKYNPNNNNKIDKIVYNSDYDIRNTKLNKNGNKINIPSQLLDESLLIDEKLYIKFHFENQLNYKTNSILVINLITKENTLLNQIDSEPFTILDINDKLGIINNQGIVKILD